MKLTDIPTGGVRKIVVYDERGPVEFTGEILVDVSWSYEDARTRGHQRWTNMSLYRVLEEDSDWSYVVQVMGRSVVYHRPGGPCHRGVVMTVNSLAQDDDRYQALESCAAVGCRPVDLEDLSGSDTVSVEVDFPTLYRCRTAEDVVGIMYQRGKRESESGLSMKMLQAAVKIDDGIRNASMKEARRL